MTMEKLSQKGEPNIVSKSSEAACGTASPADAVFLGTCGSMKHMGILGKVAMPSAPHTALSSDSCFVIASSASRFVDTLCAFEDVLCTCVDVLCTFVQNRTTFVEARQRL